MTPERLHSGATPWSLVRRAHREGQPESAAAALQQLVQRYAAAVRKYIDIRLHHAEDADEVAQDVLGRLLRGDFAGANPDRDRWRDLQHSAVRAMIDPPWDWQSPSEAPADEDWQQTWTNAILDQVWAAVKDEEQQHPEHPAYTVLRLRTLHPEDSSSQLAIRLAALTGNPVRPDAFRQLLRRARVTFAEALVAELRLGLADPGDEAVRAELTALNLQEYVEHILPLTGAR